MIIAITCFSKISAFLVLDELYVRLFVWFAQSFEYNYLTVDYCQWLV